MLAILRQRVSGATILEGKAEEIPLPAASLDAVLAGAAWHWFDERAALEIARVLRDQGRLLVMGTSSAGMTAGWVRDLYTTDGLARLECHREHYVDVHLPSPCFSAVDTASFPDRQLVTTEGLVESFTTHSIDRTADDRTRRAITDQVRAALDRHFPAPMPSS